MWKTRVSRAQGLTAEDVTVTLAVPAGTTVVTATGAGYQGVRRDEQAKADVAVWTVPRMAPEDHQTYTLTLSQAATAKTTCEAPFAGRSRRSRPVRAMQRSLPPHRSERSLNS